MDLVFGRFCFGFDAARTREAAIPVGLTHVVYAHLFAWFRGVDELVVTHVDAHVAESLPHGVEEHQVAGLQILFVDFLSGGGLLTGATGQHLAHGLFEHGADKAAAIEAGVSIGASTAVGHAQECHGIDHQVGGTVAYRLTHLVHMRDDTALGQIALNIVCGIVRRCRMGTGDAAENQEGTFQHNLTF